MISFFNFLLLLIPFLGHLPRVNATIYVDSAETAPLDQLSIAYWDIASDPQIAKRSAEIFTADPPGCVVALNFAAITERCKLAIDQNWNVTGPTDTAYGKQWWTPAIMTPWCLDGPVNPRPDYMVGDSAYPDSSVVFKYARAGEEDDGLVIIAYPKHDEDHPYSDGVDKMDLYFRNDRTETHLESNASQCVVFD